MIRELGVVLGWWLLSQGFILPVMIVEDDMKTGIIIDLAVLVLLYVLYFGLKLIGVDTTI